MSILDNILGQISGNDTVANLAAKVGLSPEHVESAIAALQEGAYDYLVKPCDIESMKHTIRRGVEHRRLMLAEQKARTASAAGENAG